MKGKYPVSQWKAGEIIRDEHNIRLPAELAASAGLDLRSDCGKPAAARACRSSPGPHDDEGRVMAATIPVHAARQAGARWPASATSRA